MTTPLVDIAIEAMDYIGRATIRSFTDKSTEAAVCQRAVANAVLTTLEDFDWGFARTIATGALLSDEPLPPGNVFLFAYAYPSNAVKVRRIGKWNVTDRPTPFDIGMNLAGERVVYTTLSPASIVFTHNAPNLLASPPSFRTACAWNLASRVVGTLRKGEPSWQTKCENSYRFALSRAATGDANEASPDDSNPDMPDQLTARGYNGPT